MLTSRLIMASGLQVAIQYLAISSFLANPAYAFFPTNWRQRIAGNGGTSHEQITNDMYDSRVADYFPEITIVSAGMTKARKTIAKANIDVDSNAPLVSAAHFDAENIAEGQERLQRLFQDIKDRLAEDKAELAQIAFGSALHTLQDFYSHTNWVELGNRSPHPRLGRSGPIGGIAGTGVRTCNDCAPLPEFPPSELPPRLCPDCINNTVGFSSLTSGFYFGQDVPAPPAAPAFKCHHGGYSDNTGGPVMGTLFGPSTPGINKDSNACGWSPHFNLHPVAAQLALEGSNQFLDDLKEALDSVKLKQLLGIGPTLALAVDTTGSMSSVISSVREQCLAIIEERAGTADESTSYVLSPFNDPDIGPLTVTSDRAEFESAINALYASGGGDCPELSIGGMIAAVEALDGGSLFMFTDAAALDASRTGELITKANAKDISIYVFKFDSGCDSGGTTKMKKRGDADSDRVYGEVTLATGGQYRSLPVSDAGSISGLIETLTTSNNRYILKIEDVFSLRGTAGGSVNFEVPVDSRMTRVTFSASGTDVDMEIRTPSDNLLDLGLPNVDSQALSDGEFVIITNPVAGVYRVVLRGRSAFSLDVTGSDPLSFSAFDVVSVCGRNGHRGYCPIEGPPAYDHDVGAVATIDGGFTTAVFEIRDTTGKIILTIPMEAGSGEDGEPPANSFFGRFSFPQGQFYVYLSGYDINNIRYQRLLPSLIVPYASGTNNTGLEDTIVYVNGTNPSTDSSTTAPTVLPTSPTNSTTLTTRVRPTPGIVTRPSTMTMPPGPSSLSIAPSIEPSVTTSPETSPASSYPTTTRIRTPGVVVGVAPGGGPSTSAALSARKQVRKIEDLA